MHADPVCPGLREHGNKLVGILDHQVAIERQLRYFADGLHHGWSERDIRHKMPVHHVDMDCRAAGLFGHGNSIGQTGEIRGED
jgi:hypothetical protein